MNKEELLEKFNKNVAYLQRIVPPDDIYIFTEQTFMAALFFLQKWAELTDVQQACKDDPVTAKWVRNIAGYLMIRDNDEDAQIDLDMDITRQDEASS